MPTPTWLKRITEGVAPCPCCAIGGPATKKSFVERTLQGITRTMEDVFFSEEYAKKKGIVQSIDPRVKLVSLVMLLIVLSFVRDILALFIIYLLVLALTWVSKIELSLVIKRVWLTVALFSFLVVIPALFNIVTPGDPIFTLLRFDSPHQIGFFNIPQEITITRQGLAGVTLFVLRVTASVTLVLVVTLTTGWTELLKGISVFKIPQIFILVLGMTYRYIFLLIRIAENMFLAKKSRMIIRKGTTGEEQAWVASRIGLLLKKSFKLSEDVYSAMRSRGFTGKVKSYETRNLQPADFVALGGAGAACVAFIMYGLLF